MRIIVSPSIDVHMDSDTGLINDTYLDVIDDSILKLESYGHDVYCGLKDVTCSATEPPNESYFYDIGELRIANGLLALVGPEVSAKINTEIGYASALGKKIVLASFASEAAQQLAHTAMAKMGRLSFVELPLTKDPFK